MVVLPSVFLLLLFRMALEMAQNVSTAISKYVKGCYDCATQRLLLLLLFRLAPQQSASKTKSEVAMSMSKACCTSVQPSMSVSLFHCDFTAIIRINLLVLERRGGGGVPVSV